MKLLFDEKRSPRLVELLAAELPGSAHVVEVNQFGDPPGESLLVLEL